MTDYYQHYSDENRIAEVVDALALMTETERPFTRLVFSAEYSQARAWLKSQFEDTGLECRIDGGGNLIGVRRSTYQASHPQKVIIGSHIDTVVAGGRFDGIAGVIAGLECVHYLNQNQIDLPFDLEIIDFLGEELNVWGTSCIGSRYMAGLLTDDLLQRVDADGRLLGLEIEKLGGTGQPPSSSRDDADTIMACFELHIEQSDQLEKGAVDIGIVTNITGISRYSITVEGAAGHSGTTRMHERQDALVAAGEITGLVQDLATGIAKRDNQHFVATIGRIEVFPNGAAVVPGEVRMILDLRASNNHSKDAFIQRLNAGFSQISKKRSCGVAMEKIVSAPVAKMDERLIHQLSCSADHLKLSHMKLASGAGHDMAHLSRIAPVAMVFIPCRAGLSHCPEEFTTPQAIARGSAVITRSVIDLAG